MKRKLVKQMCNEWRSNVWLVVELIIVSLVLQFIFTVFCVFYEMHDYSTGRKLENIYCANINKLNEDSDGYVPYDSVHSFETDLDMLMVKLRSNQYVEMAAVGGSNALPYTFNFFGSGFGCGDGKYIGVNQRAMSPEMIELLGIRGLNGETPHQLADMLRKGYMILSETEYRQSDDEPYARDLVGKEVFNQHDSLSIYRVGAVAYGMRRTDFEPLGSATAYVPLKDNISTVAVRVKPGMGNKFVESLTDADMQAGNLCITQFSSIERRRENSHLEVNIKIRNLAICGFFVLLVIFLGFLGTFWFRTQQRVSDIAIRKVNGATNRDIYARFFGEGMILLGLSLVVMLPFAAWVMRPEGMADGFGLPPFNVSAFIKAAVINVLSLALLIIAGIYAPARRATHVDAAAVLKDM